MTKRKSPDQLQRRGPKTGPDQDGATWVAIEVRRELGGVGRAHGSVSRALDFLAQDLEQAGYSIKNKTLRNRYYRAAARRQTESAYATKLDNWTDREIKQCQRGVPLTDGRVAKIIGWLPMVVTKRGRN